MIYLDTSVALAELFAEDRRPAPGFWKGQLVSSRLLEYELWTRVHGRRAAATHGEAVREVLASVAFVEMAPTVLARAVEPFPALFLAERRQDVVVATYDERMRAAARAVGLGLAPV
ncbi:MAG: PIN domain-containing protein [Deltaproteobacteria bacterium]|nr:PIN domain-containing protein [Deltaproteobacteria bacterium]